jgi:hypothetical protein
MAALVLGRTIALDMHQGRDQRKLSTAIRRVPEFTEHSSPCPYQKLDPGVLLVQGGEEGYRNHRAAASSRSMEWHVFVQR